ncbi:MAG: hypothetical protein HZA50_13050 [Planctomycetes bacterium]|nr:hypothetical protein [Planctomycetota bacterium]
MSDTVKLKKYGRARWVWCDLALLLIVLYYGATAGVRIWWGKYAQADLQTEVQAVSAAGQSLDFKSLAPPATPDGRNAAVLYIQALKDPFFAEPARAPASKPATRPAKVRESDKTPCELAAEFAADPAKRKAGAKAVRAILQKGAAAAALCRQARGRPDVVWPADLPGQPSGGDMPSVRGLAGLSNLLCLFALDAGDSARQADAAGYLLDALHLSDAISQVPTFRNLMIACSADEVLFKTVRQISPALATSAGRAEFETFIRKLADTRDIQNDFQRACMGDRCLINDLVGQMRVRFLDKSGDPMSSDSLSVWFLINPAWDLDQARVIRNANNLVTASCQESYPAALTIDPVRKPEKAGVLGLRTFTHFMSLLTQSSHETMLGMHFSRVAHRRLTACALAWRLFAIDKGKPAENLDELVKGKYLGELPRDPFSLQPNPLRLAFKSHKGIIYSVYSDGKDDGGDSGDLSIFPDGRP